MPYGLEILAPTKRQEAELEVADLKALVYCQFQTDVLKKPAWT